MPAEKKDTQNYNVVLVEKPLPSYLMHCDGFLLTSQRVHAQQQ